MNIVSVAVTRQQTTQLFVTKTHTQHLQALISHHHLKTRTTTSEARYFLTTFSTGEDKDNKNGDIFKEEQEVGRQQQHKNAPVRSASIEKYQKQKARPNFSNFVKLYIITRSSIPLLDLHTHYHSTYSARYFLLFWIFHQFLFIIFVAFSFVLT